MQPFPGIPWSPEVLLAVLSLIPLLMAWFLGFWGSPPETTSNFTVGNPLAEHLIHEPHDLVTEPIIHLARKARSDELRTLALGLRHVPVEKAAPLLRHFIGSQDSELSVFSQSTLQQGREKLQALFNQLRTHRQPDDPRIAASLLETGLRLGAPTLMAPDERNSHIKHLGRKAHEYLSSCPPTPRLTAACLQVFLAMGDSARALEMLQQLPENSELKRSLSLSVKMAAHCRQISQASLAPSPLDA